MIVLFRVLGAVLLAVVTKVPASDPERRERKDAVHAKRRWWALRWQIHRAKREGEVARLTKRLRGYVEELERLGEDIAEEEALFQEIIMTEESIEEKKHGKDLRG